MSDVTTKSERGTTDVARKTSVDQIEDLQILE